MRRSWAAAESGASPFRFRGTTLIDWLRAKDPRSRALSVSRKDRGAILPMGRAKQSVFWYASDGRFTTSTYYADTLPTWVQKFNDRKIPASYAGKLWTLLLPERSYPEPDSVPMENFGSNFVFPYRYPGRPGAGGALVLRISGDGFADGTVGARRTRRDGSGSRPADRYSRRFVFDD